MGYRGTSTITESSSTYMDLHMDVHIDRLSEAARSDSDLTLSTPIYPIYPQWIQRMDGQYNNLDEVGQGKGGRH